MIGFAIRSNGEGVCVIVDDVSHHCIATVFERGSVVAGVNGFTQQIFYSVADGDCGPCALVL